MLDYLTEFAKRIEAHPPLPDRLEIGTIAHTIFISTIRSRPPGIFAGPGSLPVMFGVQVVPKSSLPPNDWQLLASDGQVLKSGTLDCPHAYVTVIEAGPVGHWICVTCGEPFEQPPETTLREAE